MVTVDDLKVMETEEHNFSHTSKTVGFGDRLFIIGGYDYRKASEDDLFSLQETDPLEFILLVTGQVPPVDSYVMEAKLDGHLRYVPLNECSDECETGVCNKRIATDEHVGSIDRASQLLVDYLNA